MGTPGTDDDRRRHDLGDETRHRLTLQQLRSLSEDDLVTLHDVYVDPLLGYDVTLGPADYRNELDRRTTQRQTRWIIGLTVLVVVLTVVLVASELGWLDWLLATTGQ
jgi:hypothetical protein